MCMVQVVQCSEISYQPAIESEVFRQWTTTKGTLLYKSVLPKGVTICFTSNWSTHQKFKYNQPYLCFQPLWADVYFVMPSCLVFESELPQLWTAGAFSPFPLWANSARSLADLPQQWMWTDRVLNPLSHSQSHPYSELFIFSGAYSTREVSASASWGPAQPSKCRECLPVAGTPRLSCSFPPQADP